MSDTISILGYNVFTGTSTLVSDKVGGDAYFGADDGLHTLMIDLDSFIGSIKIQASIVKTPTDDDWFNAEIAGTTFAVDTTGKVGTSVELIWIILQLKQVLKPIILLVTLFGSEQV